LAIVVRIVVLGAIALLTVATASPKEAPKRPIILSDCADEKVAEELHRKLRVYTTGTIEDLERESSKPENELQLIDSVCWDAYRGIVNNLTKNKYKIITSMTMGKTYAVSIKPEIDTRSRLDLSKYPTYVMFDLDLLSEEGLIIEPFETNQSVPVAQPNARWQWKVTPTESGSFWLEIQTNLLMREKSGNIFVADDTSQNVSVWISEVPMPPEKAAEGWISFWKFWELIFSGPKGTLLALTALIGAIGGLWIAFRKLSKILKRSPPVQP
jgi:hypothetical protein